MPNDAGEKFAFPRVSCVPIEDVTLSTAQGDDIRAELQRSTVHGAGPGLLFVHWGFGDRGSFSMQASAFRGATSLTIDAPGFGARSGPRVPAKDADVVLRYAEQFIGDLTRAVDFLCAQPEVDPGRIGYVGHSLGATIAPAFLAREPRARAAVLMAGAGELSKLWWKGREPARRAALAQLDGVRCLPHVRARILFQFAERDEFISRADAEAQLAAAREPTLARWYECDHALDGRAARDRAMWLAEQLGMADEWFLPDNELLPRGQIRRYRAIKPLLRIANWFTRR